MKVYHRLRTKLIVIVCVITCVPVLMTGIYAIQVSTQALTTQAIMEQIEQAKTLKNFIESFLASTKNDLLFLSQSPMIEDYLDLRMTMLTPLPRREDIQASEQAVSQALKNVLEQKRQTLEREFLAFSRNHRIYSQLAYLDEMGQEIVRIEADGLRNYVIDPTKLKNKADVEPFKEASYLGGKQVFVSSLVLYRENQELQKPHRPVIRYAINVYYQNARKAGIILLTVDANLFLKPLGEMPLLDQEGYFVNHPDSQKCWGGPQDLKTGYNVDKEYPNLRHTLLNQDGTLIIKNLTLVYQRIFVPGTTQKWTLLIPKDANKVLRSVTQFQVTFSIIFGSAMLIAFIFAWLLSTRITRPLEQLTHAADAMSKGELMENKLEIRDQGEIGQLAQAFERMRISMLKSFERLRKQSRS